MLCVLMTATTLTLANPSPAEAALPAGCLNCSPIAGIAAAKALNAPRAILGVNFGTAAPRVAVAQFQSALRKHGIGVTVDGIVGPKTRAAIRVFQWRNGLQVDAKVGPETLAALRKSPSKLREEMKEVQTALNDFGANLDVDGLFGPKTQAAIFRFQSENQLPRTGRPDTATTKELQLGSRTTATPTNPPSSGSTTTNPAETTRRQAIDELASEYGFEVSGDELLLASGRDRRSVELRYLRELADDEGILLDYARCVSLLPTELSLGGARKANKVREILKLAISSGARALMTTAKTATSLVTCAPVAILATPVPASDRLVTGCNPESGLTYSCPALKGKITAEVTQSLNPPKPGCHQGTECRVACLHLAAGLSLRSGVKTSTPELLLDTFCRHS